MKNNYIYLNFYADYFVTARLYLMNRHYYNNISKLYFKSRLYLIP